MAVAAWETNFVYHAREEMLQCFRGRVRALSVGQGDSEEYIVLFTVICDGIEGSGICRGLL